MPYFSLLLLLAFALPTHATSPAAKEKKYSCSSQIGGGSVRPTKTVIWEICYVSNEDQTAPTHIQVELLSSAQCPGPAIIGKDPCLTELPLQLFQITGRKALPPHEYTNGTKVERRSVELFNEVSGEKTTMMEYLDGQGQVNHLVGVIANYSITAYYFQ